MHADEATGARILSQRIENNHYEFNPQHFHGPLLSLSSQAISQIAGESSWQTLSKQTLRMGPALTGILLVLTPLLWQRKIGAPAALTTAALLATSPLFVYYNRMYIHESLLLLLAMLTLPAVFKLVEKPHWRTATLTGLGMGLMFATKETFAISIVAWLIATAVYLVVRQCQWIEPKNTSLPIKEYLISALIISFVAAVSSSFFYSNGFRSFDGVVDAIRTYFIYETTAGHEKALNYYLHFLIWPKHLMGNWWSEGFIALLAIVSAAICIRCRAQRGVILYIVIATVAHFIIYSLISYKTPWLMLVPWAHACLLAGLAARSFIGHKVATSIFTLILLLGLSYQTQQSLQASGRLANDSRNPYAYVPTSNDMESLQEWLKQLSPQTQTLEPITVIGSDYWPLPWYLKNFASIGYWPEWDEATMNAPLVFAMPAQMSAVELALQETHVALPRSLRANVSITLFLRNDIWDQWTQTEHD